MSTSSKFLPFITEKSSELAVFKAIIQRAKGSTNTAISNLFSIILNQGIETARTVMSTYHSSMTTNEKVSELIIQNPTYHVSKEEQLFWTYLLNMLGTENEELKKFSKEERGIAFSVIAMAKPEKLVSSGFTINEKDVKFFKPFSKSIFDSEVKSLKRIKIDEKGERIGFTCWDEFKAYVAVKELSKDNSVSILPVKVEGLHKEHYTNTHSTSPYTD